MLRIPILIAMLLATLTLTGCGCGESKSSISGRVTYNGEPVDNGSITFVPEGVVSNKLVNVSGQISGGKYRIRGEHNPASGSYRVEILWNKKTGRKIPTPGDPAVKTDEVHQVIPSMFNANTTLKREIRSGSNSHDFELKGY